MFYIMKIKQACERKLSPLAWQRIATHVAPYFMKKYGIGLKALFMPSEDQLCDEEDWQHIESVVEKLYQCALSKEDFLM
jgi:hypothetical protein